MPYIMVCDPWGQSYHLTARNPDVIRAWFDDILPLVNADHGINDVPAARIRVSPQYWGNPPEPDWITDARVNSHMSPFKAKDGQKGMAELGKLRERLQKASESLS